jgi:hypothetical protein
MPRSVHHIPVQIRKVEEKVTAGKASQLRELHINEWE